MTSTAVIAHYNAGVELEYMHLWAEASSEYDTAAQLATIGLKRENPIHRKIARALTKVHMKVRSRVQLQAKQSTNCVRMPSDDSLSSVLPASCKAASVFKAHKRSVALPSPSNCGEN